MSRFCVVLVLLLSGCQLFSERGPGWTALGSGYYQLHDSWPGPAQQLLQHASWDDGTTQYQFTISVLLQSDAMLLVALSPLGQELWRLHYQRGHQLTATGIAPFNQPAFARRLLAEMQLALFDRASLIPRLQQLSLQQHANRRTVSDSNHADVLQIDNPAQTAAGQQIIIQAAAYRLQITTLQQDFMP
jgi:hypothetical protein